MDYLTVKSMENQQTSEVSNWENQLNWESLHNWTIPSLVAVGPWDPSIVGCQAPVGDLMLWFRGKEFMAVYGKNGMGL